MVFTVHPEGRRLREVNITCPRLYLYWKQTRKVNLVCFQWYILAKIQWTIPLPVKPQAHHKQLVCFGKLPFWSVAVVSSKVSSLHRPALILRLPCILWSQVYEVCFDNQLYSLKKVTLWSFVSSACINEYKVSKCFVLCYAQVIAKNCSFHPNLNQQQIKLDNIRNSTS